MADVASKSWVKSLLKKAKENNMLGGDVSSVNGKTGEVTLTASDVNALPSSTVIPDAYTLPIATSSTLGGVKPSTKTDDMTQEVGVDSTGKLFALKAGDEITVLDTQDDYDALSAEEKASGTYLIKEGSEDLGQSIRLRTVEDMDEYNSLSDDVKTDGAILVKNAGESLGASTIPYDESTSIKSKIDTLNSSLSTLDEFQVIHNGNTFPTSLGTMSNSFQALSVIVTKRNKMLHFEGFFYNGDNPTTSNSTIITLNSAYRPQVAISFIGECSARFGTRFPCTLHFYTDGRVTVSFVGSVSNIGEIQIIADYYVG